MNKQEKFLLAVVLLVAVSGGAFYVNSQKVSSSEVVSQVQTAPMGSGQVGEMAVSGTPTPETSQSQSQNQTSNTGIQSSTTSTKSTTVVYTVPNGDTEKLTVNLSTKDGVITDVSFSMSPSNPGSTQAYSGFQAAFQKNQLVGKSLSSAPNLSRVGGASLTTAAFNKALGELRG